MLYFLIMTFLLLMSNNIKTQILWFYTKLMTNIELWSKDKNKNNNELTILNVFQLDNLKYNLVDKKNYLFHNHKLSINSNNKLQNYMIKFKFKNNNFRIILNNHELNSFDFKFSKVEQPKFLSVINEDNQDITNIINEYSGPERNFYKDKFKFNLEQIYLDSEFKSKTYKFKIIDNKAEEKEINNIKDFFM